MNTQSTRACLSVALLSTALSWPCLALYANVDGHFTTRDGKTHNFTGIQNHASAAYIEFKYGLENKQTTLPLSEISEIVFGERAITALIRLRDGRSIDARCVEEFSVAKNGGWESLGGWPGLCLAYTYYDEIGGKTVHELRHWGHISVLTIGETSGSLRRCLHCGSIWPMNYLFCPHDGARTALAQP